MEWQSNQRKGRVTDASTSPSKDDLLEESQRIPTAKRNLFADGAVGIWAKCITPEKIAGHQFTESQSAHHEESDQSCTLKADTPVQNVQRERRPRRETKQYGYGSKDQGGGRRNRRERQFCICKKDPDGKYSPLIECSGDPKNCPGKNWFHTKCLKMKGDPPSGDWYCADCIRHKQNTKPVSFKRKRKE